MRKVRSMVAAVLLVVVSACCFAGCSKKVDVTGRWDFLEMTADGQTITAEQMKSFGAEGEMYFEFTADGKAKMDMAGDTAEGTYTFEDNKITITFDGESQAGTVEDNVMTLADGETSMKLQKKE